MLKAISTHIFLKHRLHTGHLDTLAGAGAAGIELFAARHHFDYTSRAQVREIADWFRSNETKPWSMHAPLYAEVEGEGERGAPQLNVVQADKAGRIEAMDEIKRALEAAEQIPLKHMVLHLGQRNSSWNPQALEHALTAVEHLRAFARPLGVQILVENLEKNDIAQPENLMEILSVGHFDDIGICLDVGHAHLDQDILSAIGTMGERIRSVHVHDNMKDKDSHLWPGDGTIQWPETIQALAALPEPPALVLEIQRTPDSSGSEVKDRLRQTFEFLDSATKDS